MALDEIVAHKRVEVAARRERAPLADVRAGLAPSDRSLEAALRRPRTGFILECKSASPSQGALRPDMDLDALAAAWSGHADALSVVTDERYFGGSLERLGALRARVHLPLLCKDVVVEPYQVYEARQHGADAVLLMLAVLSDYEYRECRAAAGSLGMDVVTEAHTPQELARALGLEARIIGINNRNLRTLEVDLAVTERLAPRIGGDQVIVAESGIGGHQDVRRLRPLVDGFLVGSSLMRAPDLAQSTRALIHGYTKVCGLTRPEDAATACALGATHGGLIFAADSPRRVDRQEARELRRSAPLAWVGVFVNETEDRIVALAEELDLAAIQLHGEEPAALAARLRERFAGQREVWRAVRVRDTIPRVAATGADRLVLDTYTPGTRGGTGRRFNWGLLAEYPDLDRVLLGGGLTPEAVPAAEAVGTWGMDVNSGVERSPGQKDPVRLAAFFEARRGTGRRRAAP